MPQRVHVCLHLIGVWVCAGQSCAYVFNLLYECVCVRVCVSEFVSETEGRTPPAGIMPAQRRWWDDAKSQRQRRRGVKIRQRFNPDNRRTASWRAAFAKCTLSAEYRGVSLGGSDLSRPITTRAHASARGQIILRMSISSDANRWRAEWLPGGHTTVVITVV